MATQVSAWKTADNKLFPTQAEALVHEMELSKKKKFNDFYNSPAYPANSVVTQAQVITLLARWTLYDQQNPDPSP